MFNIFRFLNKVYTFLSLVFNVSIHQSIKLKLVAMVISINIIKVFSELLLLYNKIILKH